MIAAVAGRRPRLGFQGSCDVGSTARETCSGGRDLGQSKGVKMFSLSSSIGRADGLFEIQETRSRGGRGVAGFSNAAGRMPGPQSCGGGGLRLEGMQ